MRWHHIGHICPAFSQKLRLHAICVHLHRADLIAQALEDPVGLFVGRVFHGDHVSSFEDLGQQHQQILTSRTYNNLLRAAVDTACRMQIAAYCLPKARFSLVISGMKHLFVVIYQSIPAQLSPHMVWKAVQVNAPRRKIDAPTGIRLYGSLHLAGAGCSGLHQFLQMTDKIAAARPGFHVSLGKQLVIGHLRCAAADFQMLRQHPRGWKPFPCF